MQRKVKMFLYVQDKNNALVFQKDITVPFMPVVGMHLFDRRVDVVNWDGAALVVDMEDEQVNRVDYAEKELLENGWRVVDRTRN